MVLAKSMLIFLNERSFFTFFAPLTCLDHIPIVLLLFGPTFTTTPNFLQSKIHRTILERHFKSDINTKSLFPRLPDPCVRNYSKGSRTICNLQTGENV